MVEEAKLTQPKFLSSLWMRALVFLWLIVFPIVFIAIPGLEMAWDEREVSLMPVWAFVVWMLGPLALVILLKNFSGGK